ncbi:MAG: DUF1836 domain-containing protein [Coprococcus sp.]
MNQDMKKEMTAPIRDFHLPRYQEIPEVGLYLEQTAKYIAGYLEPLQDISITGSMISNYVKKKLVTNPVKKQYNRDQIAYLIFIAIAKSVLSLDNIRLMLDLQRQIYDSKMAYDYFCTEFENIVSHVFGLKEYPDMIGTNNSDEKNMLRNMIITVAHKIYLDRYFSLLRSSS